MGLFDRLTKAREVKAKLKADEAEEKKASEEGTAALKTPKKADAKKAAPKQAREADAVPVLGGLSSRLLITPWVSEKAAHHADAGTYVFRVRTDANKVEIGKAVEALWSVQVESVRTVRGKGKVFRGRARKGKRVNWKKALVTLKKGQTIDLYEGV